MAFAGVENRYSDRELRAEPHARKLAVDRGFDDTDALWDHLFEQPRWIRLGSSAISRDYFEGCAARAGAGEIARPRPARSVDGRWIVWALAGARAARRDGACSSFAAASTSPRCERSRARRGQTTEPEVPTAGAARVRTGSYLVPYSFRRLDSFAGYASGMPSPGLLPGGVGAGRGGPRSA